MILVVYGTTGELIKLLPVLRRLHDADLAFIQASTGQQVLQIPRLLEVADLPPVDVWLARGASGRDLSSSRDVPGWALEVAINFRRVRSRLRHTVRSGPGRPLVVVHGDTMTTLYGALLGRILGFQIAHIESGLRSFDLFHPFPEELNRRLTSRAANLLYAPGAIPTSNLRRGTVLDTGSNTIRDAIELVPMDTAVPVVIPDTEFGIASLHRFELLKDRLLLAETIALLRESDRRILWVEHPVTVAALAKHGLARMVSGNLTPIPRLDFFGFVALMRRSSFLISDSGGSQEESYYLDIPCLIHRKRTERRDGLGENVILSGYASEAVRAFLADPSIYRRTSDLPTDHPSDVIVADMIERGFTGQTPG